MQPRNYSDCLQADHGGFLSCNLKGSHANAPTKSTNPTIFVKGGEIIKALNPEIHVTDTQKLVLHFTKYLWLHCQLTLFREITANCCFNSNHSAGITHSFRMCSHVSDVPNQVAALFDSPFFYTRITNAKPPANIHESRNRTFENFTKSSRAIWNFNLVTLINVRYISVPTSMRIRLRAAIVIIPDCGSFARILGKRRFVEEWIRHNIYVLSDDTLLRYSSYQA
jgi:hypothetical protein